MASGSFIAVGAPSVASITPSTGPTGGHVAVTIVGSAFRLPVIPSGDTRVDPPAPSVSVTFGGRAALRIELLSETEMVCIIPKGDAGAQDVVITNLDDDGVALESQTVTASFTYYLPKLTGETHASRVIRTVLQELKRQVTPNVQWLTNVDYTPEPSDPKAAVAKLASITIVGPTTNVNRKYSSNGPQVYEVDSGLFLETQSDACYDMEFTIVLESNSSIEIMTLRDAVYRFFLANPYLEVDCEPTDLAAGTASYEMDLMWFGNRFTGVSSEDNLRRFAGSFVIRGVKTATLVGFPRDLALGMDVPSAQDLDLDGPTGAGPA